MAMATAKEIKKAHAEHQDENERYARVAMTKIFHEFVNVPSDKNRDDLLKRMATFQEYWMVGRERR